MDPNDLIEDGGESGGDDAELENMFLEAKGPLIFTSSPLLSLPDSVGDSADKAKVVKSFEAVLDAEEKQGEKGEWGFRSAKWLVRLNFQVRRPSPCLSLQNMTRFSY